ncbi:unnamed protein product [Amoebophrya sp. A25]|nr:unnamed protein product [Amoebophrya sp. A25]|eukprot:GSA25T00016253001.1
MMSWTWNTVGWILFELFVLAVGEFGRISIFVARKWVHAGKKHQSSPLAGSVSISTMCLLTRTFSICNLNLHFSTTITNFMQNFFLPAHTHHNQSTRTLAFTASGLMMLFLDPADPLARYFVYAVVVSSLMMVWELGAPFKFRYAQTRDVGITVYLIIVAIFFYLQTPLSIIRPVFFADPCGAVVGKWLSARIRNPAWIGKKTVGGTLAVFTAGYFSLAFGSPIERLFIAAVIAFAEGMSAAYDNLFIAAVVLVSYFALVEPAPTSAFT